MSYADSIALGRTAESGETEPVDQPGVVTLSTAAPLVGQMVMATLEDLDGGVTGKEWEWQRSVGEGSDWEAIPGTNAAGYEPTRVDVGYRLRAKVVYEDIREVRRVSYSEPTSPVYQAGTVVLSPDMPVVGEPVTARFSHPDSLPPDHTWKWDSSPGDGVPVWTVIDDAMAPTYIPTPEQAGRVLRARVSYDPGDGMMRTSVSQPSAPVDQRGLVVVTPQVPVLGKVVRAELSDPDQGVKNEAWKWERWVGDDSGEWTEIAGAASEDYTPIGPEDAGKLLRVRVTYDDDIGNGRVATSAPTDSVDQPGAVELSTRVPDIGVAVGAKLLDPDGGLANVVWQWERSAGGDPPAWLAISGGDKATYSPDPGDAGRLLRAVATYDDATGVGRRAVSEPIGPVRVRTVVAEPGVAEAATIPPVSRFNSPPVFEEGTETEREIALGWSGAKAGNPVIATDDSGESLTYLLTGEGSMYFEVDPVTGQVTVDQRLVFLRPGVYLVTLHAVDPKGGLASIKLSIRVLQFSIPVFFDGDRTVRRVMENLPEGALVGAPVRARDREGDTLVYSLAGGNDTLFEVDATTGQIRTLQKLDRESRESYALTLRAEDGREGQAIIEVEIQIVDENEAPTLYGMLETEFVVAENSPPGTAVGEPFAAEDPEQDPLEYSVSGDAADAFDIIPGTGQVVTQDVLDHERRFGYQFIVTVEDGRGGSDEVDVRVAVADVNESPTFGSERVVEVVVSEDLPVGGAVVASLVAADPEGDKLTYSLSGDGSLTFDIDAQTGLVTSNGPLDFESRSSYLVKVSVEDGMGGGDSVYVSIGVGDVEEAGLDPSMEAMTGTVTAGTGPSRGSDEAYPTSRPGEEAALEGDGPKFELGTEEPLTDAQREARPVSTAGLSGEREPEDDPVGGEPMTETALGETMEAHESVMDAGDDAGQETVRESPVAEVSMPQSANMLPDREQLPLWLVLTLLALTCVDGILLAVLWYRTWGSPHRIHAS